jgi:hypothetical protein
MQARAQWLVPSREGCVLLLLGERRLRAAATGVSGPWRRRGAAATGVGGPWRRLGAAWHSSQAAVCASELRCPARGQRGALPCARGARDCARRARDRARRDLRRARAEPELRTCGQGGAGSSGASGNSSARRCTERGSTGGMTDLPTIACSISMGSQ